MRLPQTSLTFHVSAPIHRVRNFLSDPQELGKCIAGVKEVKALSPTDSLWKVEVRAGFIAQLINLKAHIETGESSNRIAFQAQGQNLHLSGDAELHEEGGGTEIRLSALVQPAGPLAPLIDTVMKNTQQKLIEETIAKIRARLDSLSTVL